jgi:glucose/arabinose dehydrogenase/PKD repeat protein
LAAVILLITLAAGRVPAQEITGLPSGFQDVLVSNLNFFPTGIAFTPDGRIFLTSKLGEVRLVKNGELVSAPVLSLPVEFSSERGLLGIALDPGFENNGLFYVYYTTAEGSLDYPGFPVNRVSRFAIREDDPDVADPASEQILLDHIPANQPAGIHNAGCLRIGLDGKLYVSVGDAGNPPWAQDLGSLAGKILRLNLDGTVPDDNPFVGQEGARPEVWAYGFRNPWRFSVHPETGDLIIGDVGEGLWEEVDWGIPGANYGWPLTEGPEPRGVAGVTYPIYAYSQFGPEGRENASISGGPVYTADLFPEDYRGNYFFGDFVRGKIWRMVFGASKEVLHVEEFASEATGVVDLEVGPEGALYYLRITPLPDWCPECFIAGDIRKIVYDATGNRAPRARASAQPTSGALPLAVAFSSAGSSDPDDDPLSYHWDFGDGNASEEPHPIHTFETPGVFSVVLTVSDGAGGQTSAFPILIHAGNHAPAVTISLPEPGSGYRAGDTIQFEGLAEDPEDGALPGSRLSWTVIFHHLEHIHPFLGPLQGISSGQFTVPVRGEVSADTWYKILLTATDLGGLSHSEFVEIFPETSTVNLMTSTPGLQILLDGAPRETPHSFVGVVGFLRNLEAPSSPLHAGKRFEFVRWSDGRPRASVLETPEADTTLTAFFLALEGDAASVSLSSSDSPSVFGQEVTFTAVVVGSGAPSGMVQFKLGEEYLGPPVELNEAGEAQVKVTSLSVGAHSITAVYSGDTTYLGSESTPVAQTVEKAATSAALDSSPNPSVFSQPATLTATISPVAPGGGTADGSVEFFDGETSLGTALVSSGVATLITSQIGLGSRSLTAVYLGSASYTGSTSPAHSHTTELKKRPGQLISPEQQARRR